MKIYLRTAVCILCCEHSTRYGILYTYEPILKIFEDGSNVCIRKWKYYIVAKQCLHSAVHKCTQTYELLVCMHSSEYCSINIDVSLSLYLSLYININIYIRHWHVSVHPLGMPGLTRQCLNKRQHWPIYVSIRKWLDEWIPAQSKNHTRPIPIKLRIPWLNYLMSNDASVCGGIL